MPSNPNRIIKSYILSGFFIFLYACGLGDQSSSLVSQPSIQTKSPRASELKPGANISLLSSTTLSGNLNRISSDIISISVPRDKAWAVKLTSDPEVDIYSDTNLLIPVSDSNKSSSENKYDISFRWLPKKIGRFYLRLHASNTSGEKTEVREFALILDVDSNGGASSQSVILKKQGIEPKAAGTEAVIPEVIEMPADETIRTKK